MLAYYRLGQIPWNLFKNKSMWTTKHTCLQAIRSILLSKVITFVIIVLMLLLSKLTVYLVINKLFCYGFDWLLFHFNGVSITYITVVIGLLKNLIACILANLWINFAISLKKSVAINVNWKVEKERENKHLITISRICLQWKCMYFALEHIFSAIIILTPD